MEGFVNKRVKGKEKDVTLFTKEELEKAKNPLPKKNYKTQLVWDEAFKKVIVQAAEDNNWGCYGL